MGPLSTPPEETGGHQLLEGKVVVITAAAGTGIGSATARRANPPAGTSTTEIRAPASPRITWSGRGPGSTA